MAFTPDELRQMHQRMQGGSYRRDLKQRQTADARRRGFAEREIEESGDKRGSRPRFLRPNDILDGEYDVERALLTTLGVEKGQPLRHITRDDIQAFRDNIVLLKDKYTKGITPRNVINLSHADDIERANKQIHMAAPASHAGGIVHFITNAGPDSKSVNHHVNVEFVNFKSVVFEVEKQTASTIKNRLSMGKIRFECDCRRHTFWYRYMATIGGYGLGRKEPGFPKEKNPLLTGVACKHVLRVMQYILSVSGQDYLRRLVESDRKKQFGTRTNSSKSQINKTLTAQQVRAERGSTRQITPNTQQAIKEMERRAKQAAQSIHKPRNPQPTRQAQTERVERLTAALNAGLITSADFDFYMKVK